MKMKKILDDDKRNRHDEDDDVGDPANSSVATNDNDKDAHQHLHNASLGGELMLLPNSSKPKYLKLLK
ncbi:hypothetical protein [Oryza sativa Japonica Group]|uniref:Uncharacterized protein n=1 Tax=Oryza sativa subsp. japonica TaxID=39947 RepID=Q9AWS3_ORYSJ|nr:hypothetical protein [Oryza sativa Japonica Group]